MPAILIQRWEESEPVARYRYSHWAMPCLPGPNASATNLLMSMRKEAIVYMEEMQSAKKFCERARDYDGARMFREFVADSKRMHSAICLVIPWFCGTPLPGDSSKVVQPSTWPVELAAELDHILRRLEIEGQEAG